MRGLLVAALVGCGHPAAAIDSSGGGDDCGDGNTVDAEQLPGDGPLAMDAVIVPACPTGTWCQEPAPPGVSGIIAAVWAHDANHVFAVGDAVPRRPGPRSPHPQGPREARL